MVALFPGSLLAQRWWKGRGRSGTLWYMMPRNKCYGYINM